MKGQLNSEAAAQMQARAGDADSPAMEFDNPTHQRQTEPEPAGSAVVRGELDEGLEDRLQAVGWYSAAVVAHVYPHLAIAARHIDRNPAVGRRVFHSVLDEVGHGLSDPGHVGVDDQRVGPDVDQ